MTKYRDLDVVAKLAEALDRQREPPMTCPYCETKTTVDDLLPHVEQRCPGQPPLHRLSRWLTPGQAHALVSRSTLTRWVRVGLVYARGAGKGTRYRKRDVVRLVALGLRNRSGLDTSQRN